MVLDPEAHSSSNLHGFPTAAVIPNSDIQAEHCTHNKSIFFQKTGHGNFEEEIGALMLHGTSSSTSFHDYCVDV